MIDQQVDKVGKAFLGMTLGCARCHDHKFDPISQRDYYALAGIFASTESVRKAEWGVWSWPTVAELPETPAEQAERKARLEAAPETPSRSSGPNGSRPGVASARSKLRSWQGQGRPGTDPATRQALEKERRELEARVGKLGQGHRACRVLHSEPCRSPSPCTIPPGRADMRITIRGNAHALGDEVPRGFVRVVSQNRPVIDPVR